MQDAMYAYCIITIARTPPRTVLKFFKKMNGRITSHKVNVNSEWL